MRKVGLVEAQQRLFELGEGASRSQQTRITRRGKRAAQIVPAQDERELKKVFAKDGGDPQALEKALELSMKELIEEGRT
jgi:antitoxin (DNA-binding transcriptional repressor) of toxin-antitoxin stability system